MNQPMRFPKGFFWGTATSAYQIEGAWNSDGRGESIWDRFSHKAGNIADGRNGDIACDHYHRWQEDLQIMKELGTNAYRFSLAWPRILPEGRGTVNAKGLDFYKRLVDGLLEKGIEPFPTLYHWDLPLALHDAGGWVNRRIVDWFGEYAEILYRALGDRVNYWSTINEPNMCTFLGYDLGVHAPGVKDVSTFMQTVHHVLLAHAEAVRRGRALLPNAKFGIVPAVGAVYPATESEVDREAAEQVWDFMTSLYLDPIFKGEYPQGLRETLQIKDDSVNILDGDLERISIPLDFLGITHYYSDFIKKGPNGEPEFLQASEDIRQNALGWNIHPDGFYDVLMALTKRYGRMPIYVMENGLPHPAGVSADGAVHDPERITYLREYIQSMHRAIMDGADVRGYFVWSLLDNFEWTEGFQDKAHFGLVNVDFSTQKRTIKDSGYFYREIIHHNGLSNTDHED
ncbi:MAG TPA: GH1 family beta-glucosidase [Bacillota bacterium]|nr:GH1 family beta-glucosidase [Bacillota bacterium]